jgi:hypothetical protein
MAILEPSDEPGATEPVTDLGREFFREVGRRGGIRSGEVRRHRKRKLTLEDVERGLGPLESLDDAQRWLRQVGIWAAAGLLSGSVAGAIVSGVKAWIYGHESRLTQEVIYDLRKRLEEVEGAVQAQRLTVVR